jgi:hypothetical protein
MKKIFKIESLVLFLMVISILTVSAQEKNPNNKEDSNKQPVTLENNWQLLLDQNGVEIYFMENFERSCAAYTLKMINKDSNNKSIVFGVPSLGIERECMQLFGDYINFNSRNITLLPGETRIGSVAYPKLIIHVPDLKTPIEELLQNFQLNDQQ